MNIKECFINMGEYGAAGLYEEENRSLFYRKGLGIRRYFENCMIPEYNGKPLYPSEVIAQKTNFPLHYMSGFEINYDAVAKKNKEAADKFVEDFRKYSSTVPAEHCIAGNMYNHSMPNYIRIINEGLASYRDRINKITDVELREGLLHTLSGIENYINRCVDYLKKVSADEKLIKALEQVPMYPARDIYEALVGWNFVMYLDNCDNLGNLASGLAPYHKGEDVTEILENLYDNLDDNCGYSMSLHTDYPPITLQCLEASKGKRRPMIELFINDDTPDEVWEKAFEVIRTNNGQPAFYNEKVLLGGLKNKFPDITDEDIKKFCGGGCTEAMIAGFSNVGSLDAGINLALILHDVIHEKLEVCKSFEEFYALYISAVEKVVDKVTTEISNSQKMRAEYNPLPLRTLFVDDCIDKGVEYNRGGARYSWSIINFAGMINVVDSMSAIKDFVFDKKRYSNGEFVKLLKEDNKEFLSEMKNHSHAFGIDDEESNKMAEKVSTDVFKMLDDKVPYMGKGFLPASIQFSTAADAGKNVGATPDGRCNADALCESLGATFAKDVKGPTALLNSVTHLDLKRALGVPVLNFTIKQDFDNTVIKSLIQGYMKLGGIQMQITCTSKEMLLEAYNNPELHKNFVVRVGGYSEYFQRLSDDLKKLVVSREIH